MKVQLHLLINFILISSGLFAQTPTFQYGVPSSTSGLITYPFGVNASGARAQFIYPAGFLGSGLTSIVPINKIYYYSDTTLADTITFSSLQITMGEFTTPQSAGFAWNNSAVNVTQALNASNIQVIAKDSSWFVIELSTPYMYNPARDLMVDIRTGAQSPFTFAWNIKSTNGGGFCGAANPNAASPNTIYLGSTAIIGFDPIKGTDNAGIETVLLPSLCANNQDAQVKIKNSGTNVINSLTIGWSINGILQTPIQLNTPIDTFGSANNDTIITLGNVSFATGVQNIKAWTSMPNSSSDYSAIDDTVTFTMASALTGTYTIGTTGVFTSMPAALSALSTYGVCGPVTFLIDSGEYYGQINISGRINGASSINTVTFQGIDKAKTILSWSAQAVNSKHVIKLQNTAYVTFRDLTIRPTNATNAWGVHLIDSCLGIGIKNCIIDISAAGASVGAANTVGITVSGIGTGICLPGPCATALNVASRVDSLEIDSNTILYGYEGINITGNATLNKGRNIKIRNNTILNAYQNSINVVQQENVIVSDNFIIPRATEVAATGVGIYFSGVSKSQTGQAIVSGNRIHAYSAAGISINASVNADEAGKGLIINNMVGGLDKSIDGNSLSITDSKNWSVAHNTFNRDFENTTAITTGCIKVSGTTSNISITNNVLAVSENGAALPVHIAAASNIDSMNRNVFSRKDMSNNQVVYIDGTTYTLTNYKGGSGFNANSNVVNVAFVNDTNLRAQSTCGFPTGFVLPYVPVDFYGNTRSATAPVVGAEEATGTANNVAIVKLVEPVSPITAGTKDLRVLVQNIGSNTVSTLSVTYQMNNYFPVITPLTLNPALNGCDTATITVPGLVFNSVDTINQLLVYTTDPNGMPDDNPANDSTRVSLYAPLNGEYTIGGAGANFSTFKEATTALKSAGIMGPVTFKVNPGTYTEQLNLSGPVNGLSPVNTITFDGVDRSTRSLSYAGNAGSPQTVKIDNVKYVTIRNLTINTTGAVWGYAVHITGTSNGAKIKNCAVNVSGAGSASTSANYNGIMVCGATPTTAARIDSVEIDSNVISAGYYGVLFYASSGAANIGQFNRIRNNSVNSSYQYGINLVYQQTPEVIKNTIVCRGATGGVGIYCQNVTTPAGVTTSTLISGNIISNYGAAGISINSSTNPNASLKGRIINNVIGGGEKAAGANGLLLSTATYWAICHNTINRDFATTTNANAAALRITGSATASQGNAIINNILAVSGNGPALPLYTQAAGNTDTIDYNLYYRLDTFTNNYPAYIGANVAFNAFKTGTFNKNSVFYAPGFSASTNLTPNLNDSSVWSSNGRGMHTKYVRTDINNNPRPLTLFEGVPDIGAYEITPVSLPPMAKAIPDTIIGGTSQVFMFATDTVAKIAWPIGYYGPSAVQIRQYSGEVAPAVDRNANYMYFYCGTGPMPAFTDGLTVYYRENWKGTHLSETGIKVTLSDSGSNYWAAQSNSSVNATTNTLVQPFYFTSSAYTFVTGTDGGPVVPVKLLSFKGVKVKTDAVLSWSTASEKNTSHFEVERSDDQHNWTTAGSVDAKGNSNQVLAYSFTDLNPFNNNSALYYRLKIQDKDGAFYYSEVVLISNTAAPQTDVVLYPNVFSNYINLKVAVAEQAQVNIRITDITGKEVHHKSIRGGKATDTILVDHLDALEAGVYFLTLEINNEVKATRKIMKQ